MLFQEVSAADFSFGVAAGAQPTEKKPSAANRHRGNSLKF
jgi:hypothetical protein